MATETKQRDHAAENQTWDYAHGVPVRMLITVYLMEEIFSIRPVAKPLSFYFTFYVGSSMQVALTRHGYSHRLIGIFAHEDGPDPYEIVDDQLVGSSRWGNRKAIRDRFRGALKEAILDKLNIEEERIQYLDRIIFGVT